MVSLETAIFNLGILTISDAGSKGERADTSGDAISEIAAAAGFVEVYRDIVPDQKRLAEYLDHPIHQKAKKDTLLPLVDKIVVYDFKE